MGVLALPGAFDPETTIQDLLAAYFGWGETSPPEASLHEALEVLF